MTLEIEEELEVGELTPIQQFFHGKSIFITGVTGLIGKILLEKLIRCCPGIGTIYLLMRPKRGKTSDERTIALFNAELFDLVKKVCPSFRKKIVIIDGDLEKPRIGINDEDVEKLKQNVSIVFHSAARVKFNDDLKTAVQHHIISTGTILDLIKEFPHIAAVVHVSTSYVHRDPDFTVPEYVTKLNVTPTQLLDAMEWLDDETINVIAPMLYKEKNNSYLYTKSLGENVVVDRRGDIPTSIVRPCNIGATYKDPFPGWADSLQGMQGLMLAGAKGFLRTLYSFRDLKINIVPADLVVNTMVTAAWHVGTKKPDDVFVMNCVIDYDKLPMANEAILKEVMKKRDKYPLVNIYRYPDFTLYYSRFLYTIHAIIDQYIPAIFIDILLFIFTGKTIMFRLYRKIDFLFGIFIKVGREPWICKLENFNAVKDSLSPKDSEIFFMNSDDLDWSQYIDDCLLGGRKFVAKEDPSNIPYAIKKAKIWWLVTTIIKWCLILSFIYFVFARRYISSFMQSYVERQPFAIAT